MNSKGQTLVEVIVASSVGILVIAALTFATIFSLRNASLAKNSAQATKLAQEGLEKVRTIRDRDVEGTVSYNDGANPPVNKFSGLWPISLSCLGSSNCYFHFDAGVTLLGGADTDKESIPPNFTRQFQIENLSAEQKKVTVIVTWTDIAGSHQSKLTTIL